MAAVPGASELFDPPAVGRRFHAERKVRLGDVDPSGQLRLDATARYLQDIASDDAVDAELDGAWGWVVRRSMFDVRQPAVLDEVVAVTTYCTGLGRSWAERTTILAECLGPGRNGYGPARGADTAIHRGLRPSMRWPEGFGTTRAGGADRLGRWNTVGCQAGRSRPFRSRQQCGELGVRRRIAQRNDVATWPCGNGVRRAGDVRNKRPERRRAR
jgi:hypothetical protein